MNCFYYNCTLCNAKKKHLLGMKSKLVGNLRQSSQSGCVDVQNYNNVNASLAKFLKLISINIIVVISGLPPLISQLFHPCLFGQHHSLQHGCLYIMTCTLPCMIIFW